MKASDITGRIRQCESNFVAAVNRGDETAQDEYINRTKELRYLRKVYGGNKTDKPSEDTEQ